MLIALCGSLPARAQTWSFAHNPDPARISRFGDALTLLDIDRDGDLDLVVGAPSGQRGRVLVFLGPIAPGSDLPIPDLELVSPYPVAGDHFGDSFAVGDVDGDGRDELAIGATFWSDGLSAPTGAAFVYDPDEPAPWTRLLSRLQGARTYRMGFALAIGDFTDTPGVELAAAAPGFRVAPSGPQVGAVHLFSELRAGRPGERLLRNPNVCACGHDMQFGHRLAAGDWNGDGRADLAVAAIFNDVYVPALGQQWPGAGQVFVYGSPASSMPLATLNNPDPTTDPYPVAGLLCVYQRYGNRIHFGDAVGGDGFDELTMDAHAKDSQGACDGGRAFIYTGRTWPQSPFPFIEQEPRTPTEEELFGYRLLFADVLGDGRPDWVVGAISKLEVPYFEVYDGARLQAGGPLGPPDQHILAPPMNGAHFNEGMAAGKLGPAPGGLDRDEVVFGDPDYAQARGRAAICFW